MSVEEVTIGACRLICGNCVAVLPTLDTVDLIMTDPPYGTAHSHAHHLATVLLRTGEPAGQALPFAGISLGECVSYVHTWTALARRWVIFTCDWRYAHALETAGLLVRLGIWRKPDGSPQFTGDRPGTGWEAVAICHRPGRKFWNGGGKHAVWTFPKGATTSGHPTEKPLALLRAWIGEFSLPGEQILDPFMGSGTTGIAWLEMGRRFIGIEQDPRYFALACHRLAAAYQQLPLFPPTASARPSQVALFSPGVTS
jgi:site-specific DNA-methyltransferase (adenine-specific)